MRDFMSPEKRSYIMSCIRSKNTAPERRLGSALHRLGLRYRKHSADLPGKPDFVFPRHHLVVFVDGDFWHGWRLPLWEKKLKPYWKRKIRYNRRRDRSNRAKLRRRGWTVVRIWEHELNKSMDKAVAKVLRAIGSAEA